MKASSHERVVIGGGLFGCYSALVLSRKGYSVQLIEQDSKLMSRASYVNQARLHTGLHYPRSLLTAQESLRNYHRFRARFPEAIVDFKQIYAISRYNSKTTADDFLRFAQRLGIKHESIDPDLYFSSGTVDLALSVEEPSFDSRIICEILSQELQQSPNVKVTLNTSVTDGKITDSGGSLELSNGSNVSTDGVVIAAYAGINSLRKKLSLPELPLTFELTEIVLGTVSANMMGIGITVMDGPFWSMMPFGNSGSSSLSSVGVTPLLRSRQLPIFSCQKLRSGCSPLKLANCNTCHVRPNSGLLHQLQQMKLFTRDPNFFTPTGSLMTIKSILSSTEVDDARPTLIHKESDSNLWTVFSGKVSTLFDLDGAFE